MRTQQSAGTSPTQPQHSSVAEPSCTARPGRVAWADIPARLQPPGGRMWASQALQPPGLRRQRLAAPATPTSLRGASALWGVDQQHSGAAAPPTAPVEQQAAAWAGLAASPRPSFPQGARAHTYLRLAEPAPAHPSFPLPPKGTMVRCLRPSGRPCSGERDWQLGGHMPQSLANEKPALAASLAA